MEKDEFTTKVIFKIAAPWEIEGRQMPQDVIAFFPDESPLMSYQHIGQHGESVLGYLLECEPATPEQYADLKEELESLGYNLEIVKA